MFDSISAATWLSGAAGAGYLALAALILVQARRSTTGILLSLCCVSTAAWAIVAALHSGDGMAAMIGAPNLVRAAVWYGFTLYLFRRAVPRQGAAGHVFAALGLGIASWTVWLLVSGEPGGDLAETGVIALGRGGIALGLLGNLAQLLLLENLYRNTSDAGRWALRLTVIALGGLAAYDVALYADAALLHRYSVGLIEGRPLVALIVVPLLGLAAARNHRWAVDIHVSRTAVFHSATLIVSGIFLLALAAVGEAARQFGPLYGSQWGTVAQISLLFAGVVTLAVLLTSSTGRSKLRAVLVDHFFTHRYDYRREWLRCIATLSGRGALAGEAGGAIEAGAAIETRAVRAVAQLTDSPAGVLLLREETAGPLQWAGSWNAPSSGLLLAADDGLTRRLTGAETAIDLRGGTSILIDEAQRPPVAAFLAVPLRAAGELSGCILLAPPRAAFALDAEVFDLLRTVASEVATYLAEQRAARVLHDTESLRDYGKRFAFVAHDIKNVSSQLSLMLSNAEIHLANPEFQRDMLTTVRASVDKIGALIRRLQSPEAIRAGGTLVAVDRLAQIAASFGRAHGVVVRVTGGGGGDAVAMEPAAFDMVVSHLLTNAIEASHGADGEVAMAVRREADRLIIDITDRGCGMTPEFVRDELFRPLRTSKREGSGIGAFQARELLRAAGGSLIVLSQPGRGTTMRMLVPLGGSTPAAVAA